MKPNRNPTNRHLSWIYRLVPTGRQSGRKPQGSKEKIHRQKSLSIAHTFMEMSSSNGPTKITLEKPWGSNHLVRWWLGYNHFRKTRYLGSMKTIFMRWARIPKEKKACTSWYLECCWCPPCRSANDEFLVTTAVARGALIGSKIVASGFFLGDLLWLIRDH